MSRLSWHAPVALLALLTSFVAVLFVSSIPQGCVLYRHTIVHHEASYLAKYIETERELSTTQFTVHEINDWLAGTQPNVGKVAAHWMQPHSTNDSWGNPYVCTALPGRTRHGKAMLGVYSLGENGVSNSLGNDRDDLNSWNDDAAEFYYQRTNMRQLQQLGVVTVLVAIPFYFFFAFVATGTRDSLHAFTKRITWRFSLAHLLLVFLAFFLSLGIVESQDTGPSYECCTTWGGVSNDVKELALRIELWDEFNPKTELSLKAIEDWLQSDSDPHILRTDVWDNDFRVVKISSGEAPTFGFYSCGADGISRSEGKDPDDLNSWDRKSGSFYRNRNRLENRKLKVTAATLLSPFVFLGLLGVRYVVSRRQIAAPAKNSSEQAA